MTRMLNLMVINPSADYFHKPVLAGTENILQLQAQIQGVVFKFNLMVYSEMRVSGSTDFM